MFWRIFFKIFGAFSAKILFNSFSSYDKREPMDFMTFISKLSPSVRKDVQRCIKIPIYCSFYKKDCDLKILCWKIS
jgi:hypothetical protein